MERCVGQDKRLNLWNLEDKASQIAIMRRPMSADVLPSLSKNG
jgi:hypothetical protein